MRRKKLVAALLLVAHTQHCTALLAPQATRKTEPLRRQLATVDAWITGQRRDQSPTRADVPVAQIDTAFAAPGRTLLKFNPFLPKILYNLFNIVNFPPRRSMISFGW